MTERIVGCLADACVMQTREIIRLDKEAEYQASKIEAKDKRIAELEKALVTSFEFLSMSSTAEYLFYENNRHLVKDKTKCT